MKQHRGFLIVFFCVLCVALMIVSCSEDENNPSSPQNSAPSDLSNPSPPDNAVDKSIDVDLLWSCSDPDGDPLTYDVYFGTPDNPQLVSEGQSDTSYNPVELDYSQTYFWKIVAKDDHDHSTEGQIWNFTTVNGAPNPPENPTPENGSEDNETNISLNWSCSDPDSDPLTYDVYFGATDNPPMVSEGQIDTSYNPEGLDYSQTYYWKIVAKDDHDHSTEGSVWSFTTASPGNQPPASPTNPSPPDNAVDQPMNVGLHWSCSDPDSDPLTYDVYFGASENPPLISEGQADTSYTPDDLDYSQTYYWKIVAKDGHDNSTESQIWMFVTLNRAPALPIDPSPEDGSEDLDVDITLNWSCSDPEDDPLIYDVYFGTSDTPPLVNPDQEQNSYSPEEMTFRETYYWKIVAKDDHGNSTEGPTWTFTTLSVRDFNLTDDVTITMVWIPAGEFDMGSPNDEDDRDADEGPVHDVNIGYGFWMGKYEVTQAQWEAVTGSNPSRYDGENRPVEQVSWNDIHNSFLSEIDEDFRLPSESEWEYSCRAGTDTRFYWSDDPDYDEIGDYAVYSANDPNGTAEVGTKRPNAFGLYDMSGNVWEWCEDWYHDSYEGAPDDGSAWDDNGSYRVLRGGSWSNNPWYCRSAFRNRNTPYNRYVIYGFRLVLVR